MSIERVFLCLLIVFGCTNSQKLSVRDGMVARVDTLHISGKDLRTFVKEITPGLRANTFGGEARKQYLRSLLGRHVLELEAIEQGLRDDSEIQATFRYQYRQRMVAAYRRQILPSEVRITNQEMQSYFEESGLDKRRKLFGILVEKEDLARKIFHELKAGGDFGQLASEYSVDERSGQQMGLLGPVDLIQARRLQIPDSLFINLPSDLTSDVLVMGNRFQIIRFGITEEILFSERRNEIYEILYNQRFVDFERSEVERLKRKLGLKIVPKGLEILLEKGNLYTRLRAEQLSDDERETALFTYRGGRVTLRDYVEVLGRDLRSLSGWGLNDADQVRQVASELVLSKVMLFEGARRAGIADDPKEQEWARQLMRRLIIEELRRREVVSKVSVVSQEARDYYESNSALFTENDSFILVEVLLDSQEEAEKLKSDIASGDQTLSSLAESSTQRAGAREEAGLIHMEDYERLAMPELYQAVSNAEIGVVVGPVEVRGGYSLFKILDRTQGKLKDFKDVERKATALVKMAKKERRFEEWMDDLMEKYSSRIAISDVALAEALPDSFLSRIQSEE